jgi:putative hydrolase of the HAD superfamily
LEWETKPEIQHLNRHWMWEFPPLAVAAEGLDTTLDVLVSRHVKLGIVTNGSARAQNAKIMALHLWRRFPCIVVSRLAGGNKPDPAIFQMALEQLDLAPGDTWFVGDHPEADILGAQRAGLIGVWIRGFHQWPKAERKPSLRIQKLPDIIELIRRDGQANTSVDGTD